MSRELIIRIGLFVGGLLILPLIVLVLGFMGALPFAGTAEPPAWEVSLGQSFLRSSLAGPASDLVNPIDPKSETDLVAGMRAFVNNCSGCHGTHNAPSPWGTGGFYPRVPQFAQVPPELTAPEMFVAVRNGIRYSGMGAWDERMLSDKQVWQIVTFLDNIERLPPAVDARWKAPR